MGQIVSSIGSNQSLLLALQAGIFKTAAAGLSLKLYKNNYTPGPTSTIADFTEADFDGYGGAVVNVYQTPVIDPITGDWILVQTVPSPFTQSGVIITNTVYGWWCDDGANILLAERFDTPIEMDLAGKQITIAPRFGTNGMYGPDAYED